MSELLRTALYPEHVSAGARIVPFAGWDMPVQYVGVIDETRAVRTECGVFDVSHMGQFSLLGEGTTEALNRIVSADWATVGIGRVAYALLVNEAGGVIDDIMGYRRDTDSWLIVANASRAYEDEAHLRANLPDGIFQGNSYADQAMLAVQGPASESMMASLFAAHGVPAALSSLDPSSLAWRDFIVLDGASPITIARGGYTGCDGYEIMSDAATGTVLWQALMGLGCAPTGLAARDALRLEAALPLYGHELNTEWTPYESGCGFAVKLDKGDFIGRSALVDATKPTKRVRALRVEGKAIPREEYPVAVDGEIVGKVTSGSYSPTLSAGIALAMLPATVSIGDFVDVLVRDKPQRAEVVKPPFVANGRK